LVVDGPVVVEVESLLLQGGILEESGFTQFLVVNRNCCQWKSNGARESGE